jgi:hypothetical protein
MDSVSHTCIREDVTLCLKSYVIFVIVQRVKLAYTMTAGTDDYLYAAALLFPIPDIFLMPVIARTP